MVRSILWRVLNEERGSTEITFVFPIVFLAGAAYLLTGNHYAELTAWLNQCTR